VDRGGIEPPTPGFSVLCSPTDSQSPIGSFAAEQPLETAPRCLRVNAAHAEDLEIPSSQVGDGERDLCSRVVARHEVGPIERLPLRLEVRRRDVVGRVVKSGHP